MRQSLEVVLICRGALIRESLAEALDTDGIEVTHQSDSLHALADLRVTAGRLGVYVWSGGDRQFAAREAGLVPQCEVRNWVVLCEDRRNAIVESMLADDRPICTAPVDVSRADLVHLVQLAARNRRLCVGSTCGPCQTSRPSCLTRASLSDRQWQLMRYLSEGLSNKEIARLERCTESTVKVRMRGLLERLEVSNRTKAAVLAARAGLKFRPDPDQPLRFSPVARSGHSIPARVLLDS